MSASGKTTPERLGNRCKNVRLAGTKPNFIKELKKRMSVAFGLGNP
jgi:hypothetical protein